MGGLKGGRKDLFEGAEESWRPGSETRGICREEKEARKKKQKERQMQKGRDLL